MPFREKAKALFRPKSRTDSSLSKTSSNNSSPSQERWPSNVYAPGEPMPRPKYRKPPTKEHKEKLEAFSFADAWRRKSYQSTYSPGGTRAPSRVPSRAPSLFSRKSFGGKSSRANSVVSNGAEAEKAGTRPREFGVAMQPRLSTEEEAEGDDDVANVGLSRVQSREQPPAKSRPRTAEDRRLSVQPYNMVTAHDHEYFSEQDLALALQRSHLAVPTQS
ncbi:hypothetical protein BAUCODRAFT_287697 [Baudoinia panamericana UAMH 10762]|uniref:Uncharacterized protein n=1 Tax=Baudoinia panamericana (strain UAMH 10762) TaxID=717646 RepID=M2LEI6_BAUPA|nr:uncharacterized protein BAUCODRAFT_287697 [Baudoinia panamericana UAMH 10762]EMC92407.1 hypothetical protein BAUCODRAFT_287697 [Baudoinia panamericana UAMH 10762]